jgi:hypothetical protein
VPGRRSAKGKYDDLMIKFRAPIVLLLYVVAFLFPAIASLLATHIGLGYATFGALIFIGIISLVVAICGFVFFKKTFRTQSVALFIFLILVLLFSFWWSTQPLGGPNGASLPCVSLSSVECLSPTMSTSGALSFTFSQNTRAPMYNVQLACAATANRAGMPNPIYAFEWLGTGNVSSTPAIGLQMNSTVQSGQAIQIRNLPCYIGTNSSAAPLFGSQPTGTPFSGSIWLNYTTNIGPVSKGNPWISQKMATITVKVA